VFQSLKRDVAYFHAGRTASYARPTQVSIAQARCGLLPHNALPMPSEHAMMLVSIAQARCGLLPPHTRTSIEEVLEKFQSLKRDVAYFHLWKNMELSNTSRRVSIAQARCGLLPPQQSFGLISLKIEFQSLKRDVAYFHHTHNPRAVLPSPCFNRSSAMWPTST